jgi:hypothetical protein
VRFVTVLAVVILVVGCSQAAPSVEKQQKREGQERIEKAPPRDPSPDLPAYDITLQQDCAETGVVGKCYGVSTVATSREELEVVTADLWLARLLPRFVVKCQEPPHSPRCSLRSQDFVGGVKRGKRNVGVVNLHRTAAHRT